MPYLVLLGLLAAIPASDLAIALINRGVTDLLGPRTLPRLELHDGVPELCARSSWSPRCSPRPDDIKRTGGAIWKSTTWRIPMAICGLRCFPTGSMPTTETLPDDDELLAAAVNGIADLNQAPRAGAGRRRAIPSVSPEARLE